MWIVWLLFFFQFAAIGVFYTYLNMYYRLAGLSGAQIGLINMSTALVGVASAVGWGYLSDRTRKNRLLIAFGAGGGLLVVQLVPLAHSFVGFLLLGCLGSLLNTAPGTLVDSTTLALLGERREDYGRYRLGGSFGYILTALSAGFIFDRIGIQWMFPAYGMIMACFVIVALRLPDAPYIPKEHTARSGLGYLARQPAWVVFTLCVFLAWIASNASIMFMGVVLQSMGASQSLIGVAVTIGAIVEVPLMMFSGRLLRRFGAVRLFTVALILNTLRFFLLAWMPAPGWAVLINLLNGPAFVFFWTSAVTYINKLAPRSLSGTAQGLFNSTTSLAGVVSSLLTGILFDQLGPHGMFSVMGFSACAL